MRRFSLVVFIMLLMGSNVAYAHDEHPEHDEWYATLMRPDDPRFFMLW